MHDSVQHDKMNKYSYRGPVASVWNKENEVGLFYSSRAHTHSNTHTTLLRRMYQFKLHLRDNRTKRQTDNRQESSLKNF